MAQLGTPASRLPRLLIVDDHPVVLDAARNALLAAGVAESIDSASTLQQAHERLASNTDIALVILDLSLTDASRLEAVHAMREKHPDIPVLIFSGDESPETIAQAFECCVLGYVAKSQPLADLVSAVRTVLADRMYISPEARRLLGTELPAASAPALPYLTARQTEVYKLMLQGIPYKVVASRLDISEHTVKVHVSALFDALQVHSRAQAMLRGWQFGLI